MSEPSNRAVASKFFESRDRSEINALKAKVAALTDALQRYQKCVESFHDVRTHADCADCIRYEIAKRALEQ